MEDAHTHLLSLPDDHDAAFFAVYDGHGGAKVAKYASCHVHRYSRDRFSFSVSEFREPPHLGPSLYSCSNVLTRRRISLVFNCVSRFVPRKIVAQPAYQNGNYVEAIQQAFLEVDQDMLNGESLTTISGRVAHIRSCSCGVLTIADQVSESIIGSTRLTLDRLLFPTDDVMKEELAGSTGVVVLIKRGELSLRCLTLPNLRKGDGYSGTTTHSPH